MEGSPEHPRTRWEQEKGILCSLTGSGGSRKSARRLGCSGAPQGSAPERGLRGGSPEPHVFHSALCLEPAPRLLLPWKQNRGGGGGRSEAGLGPVCVGGGEVGLAGCCLGNGN